MNPAITQLILSVVGPLIVALVGYIAKQLAQMNRTLTRLDLQMMQSDTRVTRCEGNIGKLYDRTDEHAKKLAAHDTILRRAEEY
jgi:hypothetical protein